MSVLTKVETKSAKGILFLSGVIIALLLGSVTMIYPFIIMMSGSLRSEMDSARLDVMPDYLVDNDELVRKFLETKYNFSIVMMNLMREDSEFSFELIDVQDDINQHQVADLQEFTREFQVPDHWWILGGTQQFKRILTLNVRLLADKLKTEFDGNLDAFSAAYGSGVTKWGQISYNAPEWHSTRFEIPDNVVYDSYTELLHERPLADKAFVSLSGAFIESVIKPTYGPGNEDQYNQAHVNNITHYSDIHLTRTVPPEDQPTLRKEWLYFVHEVVNKSFVRADVDPAKYRKFLKNKYDSPDTIIERWSHRQLQSFDDIDLPEDTSWIPAVEREDWTSFIDTLAPEQLYLVGPEFTWAQWVQDKYGSIEQANAAYGTDFSDFRQVRIPMDDLERQYVAENASDLRWRFAMRNYLTVLNEIVFEGRPLFNTAVYVILSLGLCLTLQPLAAYSLSRFQPPGMWRFILIFMATMAFPPMVGMIPQFLILRTFNLLNTFIGLVLPIVVNGYLVFLLKGFFDSLPRDLYDAALIDGASEMTMFWHITMALSKPILAVVALQTFRMVWMSFMYPLLVCPKEEMHVLAVWLYDFQQQASSPAVFTSVLITSVPTLLIFLFTQRTIMKGIAVPTEK